MVMISECLRLTNLMVKILKAKMQMMARSSILAL